MNLRVSEQAEVRISFEADEKLNPSEFSIRASRDQNLTLS